MKLLFIEDEYYTRNGILNSIDWKALGISPRWRPPATEGSGWRSSPCARTFC